MPGIILGHDSIRMRPPDEPMVVSWFQPEIGTTYGVALRMPSVRRDVIKLYLISVSGAYREVVLTIDPDTRALSDGKIVYEIREPGSDAEVESCINLVKRSGIHDEDDE